MLDNIKWFFRRSMTVLWARFMTIIGAVAALLLNTEANGALGTLVRTLLDDPKYIAIGLAVVGIVTELARTRSLGK